MWEFVSLQERNEGAGNIRSAHTPDFEEEVLTRVSADPSISAPCISRAKGASHNSVWRVIHKQQLHPYHPQRVYELIVTYFAPRDALCQRLQLIDRPAYLEFVYFTNEASFHRNGFTTAGTRVRRRKASRCTRVTSSRLICCAYLSRYCKGQSYWAIYSTWTWEWPPTL